MTDDELSRIRQTLNDALMMVGDPRQNQFAKRGKIEAKLHAATRMIEAAFDRRNSGEVGEYAVALIAAERRRQVEAEGWTPAHDDEHDCGQLAKAAASYALGEWLRTHRKSTLPPDFWPWDNGWWKPTPKDRVRELIKAGALIAAEIDRLKRTEGKGNG